MIVEINDFAFGKLFNYEYEIFCNGRKSVFKVNNRAERVTEIENDDVVEIRAKNTVYSSESIGSIILSYWLLGF